MIGRIGGQPGTAPLRAGTGRLDLGAALAKAAEPGATTAKTDRLGADQLDFDQDDPFAAIAEAGEEAGVAIGTSLDAPGHDAYAENISLRARQTGGGGEGYLTL